MERAGRRQGRVLVAAIAAAVLVVMDTAVVAGGMADESKKKPEAVELVDDFEQLGDSPAPWRKVLWPFHAGAMAIGAVQLYSAFLIARRRKWDRTWFAKHRVLGISSPFVMFLGGFVAFRLVQLEGVEHIGELHGMAGAALLGGIAIVPVLGLSMSWFPRARAKIATIHVLAGRVLLGVMLAVLVSGFLQEGIF